MKANPAFRIRVEKGSAAVLVSGGLDSAVLLAEVAFKGRTVYPIYVRAGLVWEREELKSLRRFLRSLGNRSLQPLVILELPMRDVLGDSWSTSGRAVPGYDAPISSNYIVGRNLTLLSKAAVFCARRGIGMIALALLKANPFPDARPEFFRAFSEAVNRGLKLKLQVSIPFAHLSKAQVIRRGRHLPLELTMSCARPQAALHCGRCTKCAERQAAFKEARVQDPTRYAMRRRTSPK